MAKKYALNWGAANVAARAGQLIVTRLTFPVGVRAIGDSDVLGILPANHRLVPELCSVVADAACPALAFDVCVDNDATKLGAVAVVAATAAKTPLSDTVAVDGIGSAKANREVYLKHTAAAAAATGTVSVTLAYFAG